METLKSIVLPRVLAFILWVVTVVIGLVDVYFAREIFWAVYARFSTETHLAAFLGDVVLIIGALVFLGFVIMTSEYHVKHVGKHESWDLFTRTLVVEMAIPLLAFFMGGSA
jgi:hypothetical protein